MENRFGEREGKQEEQMSIVLTQAGWSVGKTQAQRIWEEVNGFDLHFGGRS